MLNVKNVFKTAGFMIIATLLAKIMGMYRDVLLASLYGTGSAAVAFSTASRIPLLFFDITLGAAISSSFIPVFNEYLEKGQKEEAFRFSNSFINLIMLFTGIVCVLGIFFSYGIVNLIGSGLDIATKELASSLVVILFPTMLFTGLAYSLASVLQSLGEFNIPAAISLVSNGIMVVYLFFAKDKLGIHGVAVAMLVGWSFQVLIQIPSLIKKRYRYQWQLDLKNEGLKKSARLALPILISSWVQPINATVNIYLASGLNGGRAIAALDYANKLYIIFVGVLTYAISNLIFPSISRLAANHEKDAFNDMVLKALRVVLLVITPVMILFLLLRIPLVQFVYERGEFDTTSTMLTAKALLFYSIGMMGYAACEILNKAFYSMHNGKTPMYIAMFGIATNIFLSFFFVRGLGGGLGGLALAASISATLIAVVLIIMIHRTCGIIKKEFWTFLVKIMINGLIMGVAVYLLNGVLPFAHGTMANFLRLAVLAVAGVIIYLVLMFVMKIEEGQELCRLIKK